MCCVLSVTSRSPRGVVPRLSLLLLPLRNTNRLPQSPMTWTIFDTHRRNSFPLDYHATKWPTHHTLLLRGHRFCNIHFFFNFALALASKTRKSLLFFLTIFLLLLLYSHYCVCVCVSPDLTARRGHTTGVCASSCVRFLSLATFSFRWLARLVRAETQKCDVMLMTFGKSFFLL